MTIRAMTGAELPRLGWITRSADERIERENWHPIRNKPPEMPVKPDGGLWTSPFTESGLTSWQEWCESENFDTCEVVSRCDWTNRLHMIEPDPHAVVVVIDTFDDLAQILEHYCRSDADQLVSRMWAPLDFVKLSTHVDALYLTEGGQCRTRCTMPSLYGWDCATVLWLQFAFTVGAMVDG